jgi:hypothetical protein
MYPFLQKTLIQAFYEKEIDLSISVICLFRCLHYSVGSFCPYFLCFRLKWQQSRDNGNLFPQRLRFVISSVLLIFLVFCVVFLCFVCLCPVSYMSNTVSVSGLSLSCVLYVQYCLCLWIVFVLCLVCPILSVSLDCLCPVSCVSNTVSFSGLSLSCVLCVQCCQ